MKFEKVENGYNIEQVDKYIEESYKLYTDTIKQQKELIDKLVKQNKKLERLNKSLNKDKIKIAEAIKIAMDKTNELNQIYASKVQSELTTLKNFRNKWAKYYKELVNQYPIDKAIEKAGEIDDLASDIVDSFENTESDDYLFDYEKAIHPTESLSDILESFGLGPENKK